MLVGMRQILAAMVLAALGACYTTSGGDERCWGLLRTEQRCVYRSPAVDGVEGYECARLKRITYDYKTLPASEVVFDCRESEADSTITVVKPGEACEDHWVGGCVE